MSERAWKRSERRIAEVLGGRRVPVSGRGRGDAPDIEHPALSIEVKTRKSLPAWIKDALAQAEASSTAGRVPVVVLHERGKRYASSLAVMRLEDFADCFLKEGAHMSCSTSLAIMKPMKNYGENGR